MLLKTVYEIRWVGNKINDIYEQVAGTKKLVVSSLRKRSVITSNIPNRLSLLRSEGDSRNKGDSNTKKVAGRVGDLKTTGEADSTAELYDENGNIS